MLQRALVLLAILSALFGDPRAILFSRVLAAVGSLCPGAPVEAAAVITVVAWESAEPERAAVLLLAAGAHETCFRTVRQMRGGPARSWWQVEPLAPSAIARVVEADILERDPLYAARRALVVALRGWQTYACGGRRCPDAAAELRRYEVRAAWALR